MSTPTGLLALLEQASRNESDHGSRHGLSTATGRITWTDLWSMAASARDWVVERDEHVVCCIMENTPEAVAVLVGALRAGVRVHSLPLPHRGQDLLEYAAMVEALRDGGVLIAGEEVAEALGCLSFRDVEGGVQSVDRAGGLLVQYSSGSTGRPKGVVLDDMQLGANVKAIRDRLGIDESWSIAAWLPLSHDMGLIGMLLCAWAVSGECRMTPPERFAMRPLTWLDDLSETRASITAAPNFALELVLRAMARRGERTWDLSNLRCVIVGGEMVRADTLRRFARALEPYGLSRDALAPAYGMAEAALAVSLTKPGDPWRVVHLEREDLAGGVVPSDVESIAGHDGVPVAEGSVEVVVSGEVLDGYTVHSDAESNLFVEGPSVTRGYLGCEEREGALATRDRGVVLPSGEVVVVGRSDEVVVVRGRNLHPDDVEEACSHLLRRGCVVAVPDGQGGLAIVGERPGGEEAETVAAEVRKSVSQATGTGPSKVVFVKRGTLFKTPSGKPKRRAIAAALLDGRLQTESAHTWRTPA